MTADVHVGSLLSSLVFGLYQRPDVQSVQNLMLTIKPVPAGASPRDGVTVTKNVDYPTFAKAVDDSRKPGPERTTVLRLTRPQKPPEFSTDAAVSWSRWCTICSSICRRPREKPRAESSARTAKVYRVKIPLAEIALSYKLDSSATGVLKIQAKVEEFNPGPNADVLAITDDEAKGTSLSRFSAGIIMSAMAARLRSQPIDVALDQLKLPGMSIRSISPLDPSGWVRVGLSRNAQAPGFVAGTP